MRRRTGTLRAKVARPKALLLPRCRESKSIRTRIYDPIVATNEDLLRSIDAKLSALLTLVVDGYLRETGVARPKERSIDKMLSDVGLSAAAIARVLGKT